MCDVVSERTYRPRRFLTAPGRSDMRLRRQADACRYAMAGLGHAAWGTLLAFFLELSFVGGSGIELPTSHDTLHGVCNTEYGHFWPTCAVWGSDHAGSQKARVRASLVVVQQYSSTATAAVHSVEHGVVAWYRCGWGRSGLSYRAQTKHSQRRRGQHRGTQSERTYL